MPSRVTRPRALQSNGPPRDEAEERRESGSSLETPSSSPRQRTGAGGGGGLSPQWVGKWRAGSPCLYQQSICLTSPGLWRETASGSPLF